MMQGADQSVVDAPAFADDVAHRVGEELDAEDGRALLDHLEEQGGEREYCDPEGTRRSERWRAGPCILRAPSTALRDESKRDDDDEPRMTTAAAPIPRPTCQSTMATTTPAPANAGPISRGSFLRLPRVGVWNSRGVARS